MKVNKNISLFKILATLVGVAGVSALMSVPAFALTNLTRSTTGTIHSQTGSPIDDTAPGTQPSEPDEPDEPDKPSEEDEPDKPSEEDEPGKPSEPGGPDTGE